MHDGGRRLDLVGLGHRAVVGARAEDDEQVAFGDRLVCGAAAALSEHPEIERMPGGQRADAHEGAHRGQRDRLAEGAHLLLRARRDRAAAHAEQRALGGADCLRDPLHLHGMTPEAGLIAPDRGLLRVAEIDQLPLDVDGHVDQHRPAPPG